MLEDENFLGLAKIVALIDDNITRWKVQARLATLIREDDRSFDRDEFNAAIESTRNGQ